jgi:hypothetical protein
MLAELLLTGAVSNMALHSGGPASNIVPAIRIKNVYTFLQFLHANARILP